MRACLLKWGCIARLALTFTMPVAAAAAPPSPSPEPLWRSVHAVHLLGLPETKPKLRGTLSLSPGGLLFTSPEGRTAIDRPRLIAVSVGGERIETGGTMGKIARSAIPFGGGQVLATMTTAQVSLLTVEFRDERGAYHGTVFQLPKDEAARAKELFASEPPGATVAQSPGPCASGSPQAATMKVEPILSEGPPLPAEYKVLLYEQMLRRLRETAGFQGIYRDGDRSAACPEWNLALTVHAFAKGNAALRASTGPLGIFVGATSLKFRIELRDATGRMLLDKDLKAAQRGDNESLDIADTIAKTVAKRLKKRNARQPAA